MKVKRMSDVPNSSLDKLSARIEKQTQTHTRKLRRQVRRACLAVCARRHDRAHSSKLRFQDKGSNDGLQRSIEAAVLKAFGQLFGLIHMEDKHKPIGVANLLGPNFQTHKSVMAIVFCDLVGSSEMSLRLDIEVFNEVLRDYRELVSSIIEPHRGFVARVIGDGLFAYFVYPRTLRDDATAAVRSALSIIKSLPSTQGSRLCARAGIAGREVLVSTSDKGIDDRVLVIGFATNLAAKLQALASPSSANVSYDVFQASNDAFSFENQGLAMMNGSSNAAVPAWSLACSLNPKRERDVRRTEADAPIFLIICMLIASPSIR